MKNEISPDQFFISLPSLTALKAFAASARYSSFTDASKALCVTQSAVSRQVRELEQSLNVSLFNRIGRSIELTEEGKKLYETTYICFSHLLETANEIKAPQQNKTGQERSKLTIAMTHAFAVMWMAHKMADFKASFPEIDLNIFTVDDSTSMEKNKSIDGFLCSEPSNNKDVISTALFSETVYPVCTPRYLSKYLNLSSELDEIPESEMLHLQGSLAHLGFGWKQWFEFCNINSKHSISSNMTSGTTASNYQFLIQMVLEHQGIALGWDHLVKHLLNKGKLIRPVPQKVHLGNYTHYFNHRKNSDKESELLKLKNWLIDQF